VVATLVDVNGDGEDDFRTIAGRSRYPHPGTDIEEYVVGISIQNIGSSVLLTSLDLRISLQQGEIISSLNQKYSTETGNNRIVIGAYVQLWIPDGPWTYQELFKDDPGNFWRTERSLLIGCRISADDGLHHGWIRLTRPDTLFTTPFDVESFDWNPLPGEPIKAGQPPEIPLVPEIIEEGLRLRCWSMGTRWTPKRSGSPFRRRPTGRACCRSRRTPASTVCEGCESSAVNPRAFAEWGSIPLRSTAVPG
jgi:hypothetical protein